MRQQNLKNLDALARKCGTARSTTFAAYSGKTEPSPRLIAAIATGMNIPVGFVVELVDVA